MAGNRTCVTERLPRTVGLLGGGVIGGGWAARFILNGVDVRLYDPAPDAAERVNDRLAKARRAFEQLTQASLLPEGTLSERNGVGKTLGCWEQSVREIKGVQDEL